MSFSSKTVRQLLNDDFICTTINTVGDPTAGMSMGHAPNDRAGLCSRGIGKQNVQCLFVTPKSEIFHAVSGFVGPKDFQQELVFAKSVYADLKKTSSPAKQKQIVAESHTKRLKTLGFTAADLTAPEKSMPEEIIRQVTSRFGKFGGRANARRRGRRSLSSALQGMRRFDLTGDNFHATQNPGMFAFKGRPTVLRDHKFMVDSPMLPLSDFLKEPQQLVGYERTAFATGEASGGSIGGPTAPYSGGP